ncbi:hypothetical protein MSAN_02093900 [Mycena sanguinolenta]|uniref:Uncharacterized protein n=1 Tax=Mycena sanguinolenta TaxID=230812 RepID=A0A8H6XH59_9AGAR|nr:hypothetical protein MSAN_02093900 [Mycena sanguinolenta]
MAACACFGPNDSYFLNSPNQWSRAGLPEGLNRLFTMQPKLREVHEMALGARWLRDLHTLQITLGPNRSYFAFDESGATWGNLPTGLNQFIAKWRDAKGRFKAGGFPQNVSLGADGSYVYTTVGGGGAWNLCGAADELDSALEASRNLSGICVILSPCRLGMYLVIFRDGRCASALPDDISEKYAAFAADWKKVNQAPAPAANRQVNVPRNSANLGRTVLKGLGLVNQLLNAENGNSGGGWYSGGGFMDNSGGGSMNDGGVFDMSSFWQPIEDAASDPIQ